MIKVFSKADIEYRTIEPKKFPNGEINFEYNDLKYLVELDIGFDVLFKWENDADLMHFYMFTKYLEQLGIKDNVGFLNITYLPYSRMDRVEEGHSNMFSLKYIAEFINSLNYDTVVIAEAHSPVTEKLIKNSISLNVTLELLSRYIEKYKEPLTIVLPDKGAYDRYSVDVERILKYSKIKNYSIVYGEKERDFETGKIKGIKIIKDNNTIYDNCIILDDLTSYGGTFVGCKKALDNLEVSSVSLILTHAEKVFTSGKLFESGFKDIIVTDSMLSNSPWNKSTTEHVAQVNGTKLQIKDIEEYL
ncbi:ribose-phosphate pyrophosphokinase [Mammaliicoccus virus vB_MscM-PMS2]|nr:ribose-phosphate pyrophosphokinase [Mammaliicoccus virus vB_MscM-PMS2]